MNELTVFSSDTIPVYTTGTENKGFPPIPGKTSDQGGRPTIVHIIAIVKEMAVKYGVWEEAAS